MPIYEYECLQCGKRTEWLQRMSDPPLAACPQCGGKVRRLISAPAFQFKGSGFYKTDYGSGTSGGKSETKSESKAETKTESKPEAKAESKSESSSTAASSESKSTAAKSE